MVVFTCNHCGDSLQKPRVEKHYQMACRQAKSLTCVDCLKDFRGEEFVAHNKCISEVERYSAKGSLPAGMVKKGEAKQESWTEMIKSIIDKEPNLIAPHRNLLNTISSNTNVPRKRPKFMNFIKSSSGGRVNMKDVEAVWDIIEKYKKVQVQAKIEEIATKEGKNEENKNKRKAEETEIAEVVTKKKKKKNKENQEIKENETNGFFIQPETNGNSKEIETNGNSSIESKFSFEDTILEVLNKKNSLSLKKLEKKVMNAYLKFSGENEVAPKTLKKFNKKLKKIDKIQITEDKVNLILQD